MDKWLEMVEPSRARFIPPVRPLRSVRQTVVAQGEKIWIVVVGLGCRSRLPRSLAERLLRNRLNSSRGN